MRITLEADDAAEFLAIVEGVINGLLLREKPERLLLIKIDNWFGSNCLSFSGKALGAIGVWSRTLTVPPFVPNRVIHQKQYLAPTYKEISAGEPLHRSVPSATAMARKVSEVAPGAGLIWYSGKSKERGRGCLMSYVPQGDQYWSWYVGWANRQGWKIDKAVRIEPAEIENLGKLCSDVLQ